MISFLFSSFYFKFLFPSRSHFLSPLPLPPSFPYSPSPLPLPPPPRFDTATPTFRHGLPHDTALAPFLEAPSLGTAPLDAIPIQFPHENDPIGFSCAFWTVTLYMLSMFSCVMSKYPFSFFFLFFLWGWRYFFLEIRSLHTDTNDTGYAHDTESTRRAQRRRHHAHDAACEDAPAARSPAAPLPTDAAAASEPLRRPRSPSPPPPPPPPACRCRPRRAAATTAAPTWPA